MPETDGNVVTFTIIRKIHEKSRRGQTGSSCATWPTFGLNSVTFCNGVRYTL